MHEPVESATGGSAHDRGNRPTAHDQVEQQGKQDKTQAHKLLPPLSVFGLIDCDLLQNQEFMLFVFGFIRVEIDSVDANYIVAHVVKSGFHLHIVGDVSWRDHFNL